MNDMSSVIVPKSDQLNADTLIAGPKTIQITDVDIRPGTEQPVTIHYAGEEGQPWKPCKSMSRVLVAAWGPDAKAYIGRSVTLYRDPKVKWGGMEVGGIRVSHLTNIEREMVMALTATKGKRAPYTVKPLAAAPVAAGNSDAAQKWVDDHLGFVRGASDLESLDSIIAGGVKAVTKLSTTNPELHKKVTDAYDKRRSELAGDDPFAEGPTDSERGETNTGTPAEILIADIAEADADTLATIEAEYFDGGRLKHEAEDQDRIEQAFADAKARLGGE